MGATLEVHDVGKVFGGVQALRRATLQVQPGEVIALLGLNGAGKSTLIKIVSGAIQADTGSMLLDGVPYAPADPADARRHGLAVVHQQRMLIPHMTVAENVLLGAEPARYGLVRRRHLHDRVHSLAERYDISIDPNARVDRLGAGARQLVDLLRGLAVDARVLLLDEPTSALTFAERERLFELVERLRTEGRAIVYVSHQLEEVFRICGRVVVLRDGFVVADEAVTDLEQSTLIQLMAGEAPEHLYQERTGGGERGAVIARVETGVPDEPAVTARTGEVVGIAGALGAGCTALLEFISGGRRDPHRSLHIRGSPVRLRSPHDALARGIILLPEKRTEKGLIERLSLRMNISVGGLDRLTRFGVVLRRAEERELRPLVERMRIRASSIDARMNTLSGGNQQKAVFGRLLHTMASVEDSLFCFDEPTEGVDVQTKPELSDHISDLAKRGAAVMVTSSDLDELLTLSDRVYVMAKGRVIGQYDRSELDRSTLLHAMLGSVAKGES